MREDIESNDSVKRGVAVVLEPTVFEVDDEMVVDVGVSIVVQKAKFVAMLVLEEKRLKGSINCGINTCTRSSSSSHLVAAGKLSASR